MIFVSALRGNDASAGTLAAPVREIATAVGLATAHETILVLDGGEYAPFTVNKSLTVEADGVHAQVTAPTAPFGARAVSVDTSAGDVVVLGGLVLRGTGATTGIAYYGPGKLRVERCTISHFLNTPEGYPGKAIEAAGDVLTVVDTIMRDNSAGVECLGDTLRAVIERCRIEGDRDYNSVGLRVSQGQRIAVADTLVSDYGLGIYARGYAGSPIAAVTVSRSTVVNNRIGIYADLLGQVHLAGTTVSLNDEGLFTLNGGVIYTVGNNAVLGNFGANLAAGTVFFASDLTS
jgi:hypothetical protein